MGFSPFRRDRIVLDPIARAMPRGDPFWSVELDQILEDQPTPAVPAPLHQQSTFRKPAKVDRRETEVSASAAISAAAPSSSLARKTTSCRRGRPDPGQDGSGQMIEALDQPAASKGLRDGLGRSLSAQFLRGHAVGIGHIDDGLPLPVGSAFATSWYARKPTARKTTSALTASASFSGMILGPIAAAADAKLSGSRVVATDTSMPLTGKCLGQAPADLAEADDCVVHDVRPISFDASGQTCAMPPSTARSTPVM